MTLSASSAIDTPLSTLELERDWLKRRQAARSLIAFTEYTKRDYEQAPHHRLIAEHLEAIERGELNRLMVFMPPRHGKSELASIRFPAWYMGRNPSREIISCGYGQQFTEEFGRKVRNLVADRDFRCVFPGVTLAPDSQAAGRWNTSRGGGYRAGSVGGGSGRGITGKSAHLLLIDDPIKGYEEAESQLIRDKVWQWYLTEAYTRQMKVFAAVMVLTRWHWDDLAGRALEQQKAGGDKWTVLSLPGINEKNEALWPEYFPLERLEAIRTTIGPRNWSSLYQQRPTPDEGGYFERRWFRYYDSPPEHLTRYGASDYAVTAEGGDFTVHIVVGVSPADDIYLLDLWREQTAADVWIETYLALVGKHQPHMWAAEKGVIEKSLAPYIAKAQEERGIYQALKGYASSADKPTRARSIQARLANGKVYFPRSAPWLAGLESELLQFPAGVTDDQVDALGLIGRMLDGMAKGHVPKELMAPRFPVEALDEGRRIRIDMQPYDKDLKLSNKAPEPAPEMVRAFAALERMTKK
jgi:predicted phage terminase large subunit-like protein